MSDLNVEKKQLGVWTLTSLVVGNMVGSGIFLLPTDLAKIGSISLIYWIATVVGAVLLALVLSRLSQIVPQNGGPFAYARQGLGGFIGFQTVYNYWVAIWVGNLGLIIAFLSYLAMLWPVFAQPLVGIITGVVVIWLLTFVNISGVRNAGILQLVTVVLKLIPIVLLIGFGLWYFDIANIKAIFNVANDTQNSVSSAASLPLWAFIGVESATIPYSSVKNPHRDIPLATLMGTVIAAIIYILSTTVVLGMLPHSVLINNASPFVAVAEMIFGSWGKWFMIVGALISCFGCINGWTMLQGQVAMAAADNNLFPGVFGVKNKRGTPALGLTITAVLESAVLLLMLDKDISEEFRMITFMASLAALIPYLYSSLAALILLKRQATVISFKDKIFFLLASLAAIYSFWTITISGEKAIFYGSILLFSSALLYGWGYGNRKGVEEDDSC